MTLQHSYLFALLPNSVGGPLDTPATLVFCGAPQDLVTKASILAGLRFKTRLAELQDTLGTWIGFLDPLLENHAHDEDALWDIVRKAANPIDPAEPPPGSRGIDQLLVDARMRLDRLDPCEAFKEALEDGILVDIRPEAQRAEHGGIPGAVIIERNVLEWRFDPRSNGRLPIADRYDLRVMIYCQVRTIFLLVLHEVVAHVCNRKATQAVWQRRLCRTLGSGEQQISMVVSQGGRAMGYQQ